MLSEGSKCPNCELGKLSKVVGTEFTNKNGDKLYLSGYTFYKCSWCDMDMETALCNLEYEDLLMTFAQFDPHQNKI